MCINRRRQGGGEQIVVQSLERMQRQEDQKTKGSIVNIGVGVEEGKREVNRQVNDLKWVQEQIEEKQKHER